jgi:NAD(P)-dependent dehydrogenase (short-subunit alcohol dehydrogenase family)
VATSRNPDAGERVVGELRSEGLDVGYRRLDVADPRSVDECARALGESGTDVDVLVNNAFGPLRTSRAFVPGMVGRGYGRVVNVSSGAGAIGEDVSSYAPAYSVSKAALNMLTRKVAAAAGARDVKVNAMCPGWVRTDMGGGAAPRSPEEAADTLAWLATLPADGPTNGFFRDRRPIAW